MELKAFFLISVLFIYLFSILTIVSCDARLHKADTKIIASKISNGNHKTIQLEASETDKIYYKSNVQVGASQTKPSAFEPVIESEPLMLTNSISPHRVTKRALGRGRLSKIALAPRPKSTTTTTTTTITSIEEDDEEPKKIVANKETESAIKQKEPEEEEQKEEVEEEEEEDDQEKEEESEKLESSKTESPKGVPAKQRASKLKPFNNNKGNSGEEKKLSKKEKSETTKGIANNTMKSLKRKPLFTPSFIIPKNGSACTPEAYLEFPRDLIGNKWRGRGLIVIHVMVVCYMFYSLALVCERYFMPSLEEFAQRLGLSQDVAGATLMSAGSSAPELFTAILGVFVAKGDVGTGAIVGSAGICAFVSTTTAQLNWWPVLRDSVFYTFTVLVLILFIYDERITALESFSMIALYGLYIVIMVYNDLIKEHVTKTLQAYPVTAKLFAYGSGGSSASNEGADDVFGSINSSGNQLRSYQTSSMTTSANEQRVEEDSMFLAACLIIVRHKRLFRSSLRFRFAAKYIICKRQHRLALQKTTSNEVNYFGPESDSNRAGMSSHQRERMEAYATTASLSKNKFSIVSKDDYEFWNRPPEEGENYYIWLAKIPVNYVLHYTCPDCTLYPDRYLLTFIVSIVWTAIFSYVMVWMVTLIGYTFGIPDSVMGVTFLAAGTSVPDCYSSVHAARNGMADMAVSNSIGSNVFDILIGLAVPWFIQSAIYPGVVATINSRGIIYSVILLFLSLVVTIYLMNKYDWTLKPRLGLALLIAYGLFILLTSMLEFNMFGHVNPPPCQIK